MKEEYKANGRSNKYIKWKYLYENQDKYLLYKDQTDVLDYLIQESNPNYIPELSDKNNADNTKQTTPITTEETVAVESTEPNNQSNGFLNIHFLIILLFLFIL